MEKAGRQSSGFDSLEALLRQVSTQTENRVTLVGHDHGIDDMDHTVGLEDIRDGHECGAALFIFQDDVVAILQ